MRAALAISLVLALAACDAPPAASCEGVRLASSSAPDRRLLGEADAYPADTALDARWGELAGSQRARRAVAWEAIARVLAPVPLAEPTPLGETTVPRFRTFYDRDDFNRIFQHLYEGLTPAERAARARFATGAVDEAFAFDTAFLDTLGTWTPERWSAYVAGFTTPAAVASIGGVRRIVMSPGLTRHLVESYPEILRCLADGAPPAEVPLVERTERLLRAPIALEACEARHLGPFFVPRGSTLDVALADPSGTARIAILEGPSVESASTRCEGAGTCAAVGPGVFTVLVTSERALDAMLEIDRTGAAAPTACLDGALPLDAVSIAAEWRRLDPDMPLPVYDTSAARLGAVIAMDTPTWGTGERTAMPSEDEIYTQRLPGGETFVLAGFHVRTRELPLGLDITVWWSDQPDEDFGADRPDAIRRLGGPWSHYKMCVAVEHTELDGDPSGGFASTAPSLGAALGAVHEGRGGPTWCSNPYIDAAPGLARGNCVGCHQHAMSGVRPGEIATDSVRFPSSGRLAARNNYPADGFWGLDAGDELAGVVQNVVDYWQ
jgi:hypothetical protein